MKLFFLCNLGTSNSAAMGCSQPKEFRTGLRIVGSFLKVKLYYNICGTQVLLRSSVRRGLRTLQSLQSNREHALPVDATYVQ